MLLLNEHPLNARRFLAQIYPHSLDWKIGLLIASIAFFFFYFFLSKKVSDIARNYRLYKGVILIGRGKSVVIVILTKIDGSLYSFHL